MPLASLPTQISGRNRVWRRDGHRRDPQRSGVEERRLHDAAARPAHGRADAVAGRAAIPIIRQQEAPTLAEADAEIDDYVANYVKTGDANDILYALESSRDYDPGSGSREDQGAAPGGQLGRRSRQSAGARDSRARDQARPERARRGDSPQRQDRRPRHAHARRRLEVHLEDLLRTSAAVGRDEPRSGRSEHGRPLSARSRLVPARRRVEGGGPRAVTRSRARPIRARSTRTGSTSPRNTIPPCRPA